MNHFPDDERFHTFLLDKENKVLAIGNPVHNAKVKELYLKIIRGEQVGPDEESPSTTTDVRPDKDVADLGRFDWTQEQKTVFVLKNVGNNPLVVHDVNTSCGCTSVKYSSEPVRPGEEVVLNVLYKAEHPEHFSKTVTVYCNARQSPVRLRISGNAE